MHVGKLFKPDKIDQSLQHTVLSAYWGAVHGVGKVTTNSGLLWIARVRKCRPRGSDVRMFKIPGQSEVHMHGQRLKMFKTSLLELLLAICAARS